VLRNGLRKIPEIMLQPEIIDLDHIEGDKNASITLVEYGDYECPSCGDVYPIIKSIQKRMGHRLRFIFRNFPLIEIHPNAFMAAMATEAAARQNLFWPMHDILFNNQDQINYSDILDYAEKIGLDTHTFSKDMENETLIQKVEGDLESGKESGVRGTPSFFINGEKYDGDWSEHDLYNTLRAVELSIP
jgi:protein-disulfide isomerase